MFAFFPSLENISTQKAMLWIVLCVGYAVRPSKVAAHVCWVRSQSSHVLVSPKLSHQGSYFKSIKFKKFNLISSWNRHESEKSTCVCFVCVCQICLRLYSWLLRQECSKSCWSQISYNIVTVQNSIRWNTFFFTRFIVRRATMKTVTV